MRACHLGSGCGTRREGGWSDKRPRSVAAGFGRTYDSVVAARGGIHEADTTIILTPEPVREPRPLAAPREDMGARPESRNYTRCLLSVPLRRRSALPSRVRG